jgi:hypothetical protein
MCFSSTVSFTAGAVLINISVYTIYHAITKNKKYLLFALMPLFFGIQQITEGFVWLGILGHDPFLLKIASLGFLFFALFFWPIFSPLSMILIEEKKESKRKIVLLVLLGLGLMMAVGMYLPLIMAINPLNTKITCGSIGYYWAIPLSIESVYPLAYLIVTVLPFFMAPNIRLKIFAVMLFLSSIISHYFYIDRRVSVWCFFAAILSFFVAYIIYKLPKKASKASGILSS